MVDIVIPLKAQSNVDHLQLKLALRSIAQNASNAGHVYVITAAPLKWANPEHVTVVPCQDKYKGVKDANIIQKLLTAARLPELSQKFMFWSDDQLLTGKLDLQKAPVVSNPRSREHFEDGAASNNWYRDMLHTFDYVQEQTGLKLPHNFQAHTPQPYKKQDTLAVFQNIPYTDTPGFGVNTVYYGMLRQPPQITQTKVKSTWQGGRTGIPQRLPLYTGYDEKSWLKGMGYFFSGLFFRKCRYEA